MTAARGAGMDVAHAKVAVLGAGNWGTVVADRVARNGREVTLWTRDAKVRDEVNLQHTNETAVPGLRLSPNVRAVTDPKDALDKAELVFVIVPAQAMRDVCKTVGEHFRPYHFVVHGTKGLELGTLARMSEIIHDETCIRQLGMLSGPNIAPEIARGAPAGTVVVSHYPDVIRAAKAALTCDELMVFYGEDVLGVEIASSLKNVVAIAAGIATEMNVGENAKAFLVTRGLAEMTRIAVTMGGDPTTLSGLAGLGDLVVTCASQHSRNHRIGRALARGVSLSQALEDLGMVAEGVSTSRAAHELARDIGVEAPLLEAVYRIIHEGQSAQAAVRDLMRTPAGRDVALFQSRA
ncbi:MAG: NAD(P)-dependent glycerol-3-phosphate dehydrogenase [Myxococcales bacterium]|nr:NAD(P)-dependent glycerol-3-phosphate dehydrogenase [Myxococcales bacterium]